MPAAKLQSLASKLDDLPLTKRGPKCRICKVISEPGVIDSIIRNFKRGVAAEHIAAALETGRGQDLKRCLKGHHGIDLSQA